MKNLKENPPDITIPSAQCNNRVKENFLTTVIGNFVVEFVLPELDIERNWKKERKAGCDQRSQSPAVTYAVFRQCYMHRRIFIYFTGVVPEILRG